MPLSTQKAFKQLVFFILVVLVVFESVCSSFLPYEFANDGEVESTVFTAESNGDTLLGQLYFKEPSSQVIFQLRLRDNDTEYNRNSLVNHYASQGIFPTIVFLNTSWNASFELRELVQNDDKTYWKRDFTVAELFYEPNVFSLRRYSYIAELGKGLNLFQRRGDVIFKAAEPLLNLQFGDSADFVSLNSYPEDLVVRSSPCSSLVAAIVPVVNVSKSPNSGCYFGVTPNYFSSSSIQWYNLLHSSSGSPDQYSLCKESSLSQCANLSIVDFALMRSHLVFVTTHGIAVSQSFDKVFKNGTGTKMTFTKVSSVHPLFDQSVTTGSLTRDNTRLFYTSHCYSDFVSEHKQEVCIVYDSGSSNGSIALCAIPPYLEWVQYGFSDDQARNVRVHSSVHDIQREAKVFLLKDVVKGNYAVHVYGEASQKFPTFHFASDDIVNGLYYHLHTASLFAFGSQVWQSLDGGNSFHRVTSLRDQKVSTFSVDLFGEVFSFISNVGKVFIGKVGMHRTVLVTPNVTLSKLTHSQVLMDANNLLLLKVTLNSSKLSIDHAAYALQDSTNIKETFQANLLISLKSATKVLFYSDCECFSGSNVGQILHSKSGGSAVITKVQKPTTDTYEKFKQLLSGYVLKPFLGTQKNAITSIRVEWSGWNVSLTILQGDVFSGYDIGKTLMLPNGYSFLLTHFINAAEAKGMSYIPWRGAKPYIVIYDTWILYDFRDAITSGTVWWIKEDICQSVLTEATQATPQFYHLDSNDQLHLTATVVSRNVLYESLPRILIGHPGLFSITSEYQRSRLNVTLYITIKQKPLVTGSSPLVIVIENSSLFCRSSSLTITIHSGCPPSKNLHYIYPVMFTDDVFLDSKALDSKGHVRNFKLPYNYRPPSVRGIAIPMTSHIYNVDPRKPHYRSSYAITRETVRYKHCAGVNTRDACGCTRGMRRSSLIEHSDCIDTCYQLSFSERLRPKFLVSRAGRKTISLQSPFYLEELNERVDYEIINPSNKTVLETNAIIMEEKINSSIEFVGSGLFHFRAHPVRENYTFCALKAEFVVFIVETPLPYPIKDIVMACTAMAFSGILYMSFLTYFHGKKKIKYE